MSETKPPGPDADNLARQLQASLAKRRLAPWKPVLALLAFCTLALVLVAWSLKQRPLPPLLPLVALDAVYTPDETPRARVQLYQPAEEDAHGELSGHDVLFQGPEFVHADRKANIVRIKSDARGQAAAELPTVPAPAIVDFHARHIDDARGLRLGTPDSGQVFVWPKDAKLLIVEADETLLAKESNPKAAPALAKAVDASWRIVYLSAASVHADEYQQARNKLQEHGDLPVGPVLGRPHYPGLDSVEQARGELLRSLRGRFAGPQGIVVRSSRAAELGVELRMRTIVIGDAKAPAEAVRVTEWSEVSEHLK